MLTETEDGVVVFSRRTALLIVVVGSIGGMVGAAYVTALKGLEHLIGPDGRSHATVILTLVGAGVAVAVIVKVFGDPGDVELLVDNVHVAGGHRDVRALRSLIPASLIGIAAGSAIGPEAPLVQTAGTLGTVVADRGRAPRADVRPLAICGMASAFAVLFGAPLGSAVFALEILHRRGLEYYEAMLPALGGALIGFGVYTALEGVGYGPVIELPEANVGSVTDLGWAAIAAVAGAAIAVVFTIVVRSMRRIVVHVPRFLRPATGGLVVGLLSIWSVAALTFGEHQIVEFATSDLAVGTLAAALVAKLVASAVCLTTGFRGGFIIPLFFAGAVGGLLLHHAMPGVDPTMLMAACMVAANVGVTNTPLGSTLVVTEMAGLDLLPSTTLAAVIAIVLTANVHLIDSQRARMATP